MLKTASRIGYHKYRVIDGEDRQPQLYHPVYRGENRISWGSPAQIAVVLIDKRCGRCNAGTGPTRIIKNGLLIRGEFDIGIENGRIFGAYCPWCGFSF